MLKSLVYSLVLLVLSCSITVAAQPGEYTATVTVRKLLVTSTAGNGQPHRYLCTDKPEVTALTVEIPPGAETGWHLHQVPVYAYVLSGILTVELADGNQLTFKQGDAIVEVQNLGHNGRNSGTEPVKLVVFYTGEVGKPNVDKFAKPQP